jgi:hypothetical protein
MMPNSSSFISWKDHLDKFEKDYLFNEVEEYYFQVRRNKSIPNFDQILESQLRKIPGVKVHQYKTVKEGYTKVARPHTIAIGINYLMHERPYLKHQKNIYEQLWGNFSYFSLKDFCLKNYKDINHDLSLLQECLQLFDFMTKNRDQIQGMAPREVPHGISTKLLGRESLLLKVFSFWKPTLSDWNQVFNYFGIQKRPTEFRFYSPMCYFQQKEIKHFHGLLFQEFLPNFDFSNLKGTLIVENLEVFYQLIPFSKKHLLIWGSGWKIASLISWVTMLPEPIYYWGDLDKEGYEIYGHFKSRFPKLKNLCMEMKTLEKNKSLIQKKDPYLGPYAYIPDLQSEYEFVCKKGYRLEQEHLGIPKEVQGLLFE